VGRCTAPSPTIPFDLWPGSGPSTPVSSPARRYFVARGGRAINRRPLRPAARHCQQSASLFGGGLAGGGERSPVGCRWAGWHGRVESLWRFPSVSCRPAFGPRGAAIRNRGTHSSLGNQRCCPSSRTALPMAVPAGPMLEPGAGRRPGRVRVGRSLSFRPVIARTRARLAGPCFLWRTGGTRFRAVLRAVWRRRRLIFLGFEAVPSSVMVNGRIRIGGPFAAGEGRRLSLRQMLFAGFFSTMRHNPIGLLGVDHAQNLLARWVPSAGRIRIALPVFRRRVTVFPRTDFPGVGLGPCTLRPALAPGRPGLAPWVAGSFIMVANWPRLAAACPGRNPWFRSQVADLRHSPFIIFCIFSSDPFILCDVFLLGPISWASPTC